jgi:hypothetical protein
MPTILNLFVMILSLSEFGFDELNYNIASKYGRNEEEMRKFFDNADYKPICSRRTKLHFGP